MIYQGILIFIIFLLNMLCHIDSTGLSHCSHEHPRDHEVIRDVFIEPEHLMKKRSIDHPLRIRLYYDTSVYKLDEQKFHVINSTILPEAVHFWEKALMVRKTENVIRLNRKCLNNDVFYRHNDSEPYCKTGCEDETMCGEVVVPRDHLKVCGICNDTGQACTKDEKPPGPGISGADFVLYVSVIQTERCNRRMAVAYAAYCQQEAALDRPIAGYANLCPDSISTKPHELEILLSTVKHEILHALGFSVSLYAFYRDDEGNPMTPRGDDGKPIMNEKLQIRQWSDKVIRTVLRPNWLTYDGLMEREMQMMVTPRVVHEARKHFNCSLLEGAELEDQGVDGTALTHWEKRVFENEAMTGTHTQNPVYSRITLALMEDTGWYRANYSMAQHLNWGHHLGCDFAMKSCKDWMDSSVARGGSSHPFCNKVRQTPLQTGCTDDRMSLSLCNLVSYSEKLPQMYRNFDTIPHVSAAEVSHYGGSVALADYCPFTQEFTWKSKNVLVRGSRCKYPENNKQGERNFALESYGGRSKCFEHTKTWEQKSCKQVRQWQHWGSGCYEYECRNGRLEIAVGNHSYTCYQQGQQLDIRIMSTGWLQTGGIICPSCEEMCQEEFESRGEMCESDADIPSTAIYHRDELKCEAAVQQQQRNASRSTGDD